MNSFRESARAGSAVVLLGVVFVLFYRGSTDFFRFLEPVRAFADAHSSVAAVASQVIFCALLPALAYLIVPEARPRRLALVTFANAVWFGLLGLVCLGFYVVQERLFGAGTAPLTLFKKTVLDQFVFNPFVLSPLHAAFFFWEARDFSFRRTRAEWPDSFVRSLVLPNLLANYIFAFPLGLAMYALPLGLRVPFMGVIGSCWSILCLRLGTNSKR